MMKSFAVAVFGLAGLASFAGSAAARVQIDIDLTTQKMIVVDKGKKHVWRVSTGRKGYYTPTGTYSQKRLVRRHFSSKYNQAPMPYSIFFRGGYAIHGTNATGKLGQPASHGCIRLAPGHAALLFKMVSTRGARIRITGATPGRKARTYAGMSEHGVTFGALSPERLALAAPNELFSFREGELGDGQSSETAGLEFLEILSSADLPDSGDLPNSADTPEPDAAEGGLAGWALRPN